MSQILYRYISVSIFLAIATAGEELDPRTASFNAIMLALEQLGHSFKDFYADIGTRVQSIEANVTKLSEKLEALVSEVRKGFNATNQNLETLVSAIVGPLNPSSSSVNETSSPDNSTTEVVPYICGGVLTQYSGVIEFRAPTILPNSHTCVWTIRADHSDTLSLTLDDENFGVSDSKLRIMPFGMLWYSYNGTRASLDQREYVAGSRGQTHRIRDFNTAFVELVIGGNASTPSTFVLSFTGEGGRARESSHLSYAHFHFRDSNGAIPSRPYMRNERKSWVILPNATNVTLTQASISMEMNQDCDGCTCDWMRIWGIASKALIGNRENNYKFCGNLPFSPVTDEVGWIVLFRSGHRGEGNVSLAYQSTQ